MIKIIVVGKLKEQYLKDAVSDYLKRLTKYHKVEIIELKDDVNICKEEKQILKYLNPKEYNILMDIQGDLLSSEDIALLTLEKLMACGNINIIIGGSNGVTDKIKQSVNKRISFGRVTLPHGLFRAIVLEQIYRGFKINNHESYHK